MRSPWRRPSVVLLTLASVLCLIDVAPPRAQAPSTFAGRIAALSEPDGYFDTDNLVSNERSYLQVLPDLQRRAGRGGAYIGVGPDQNFSYIAAVRPTIALILDVRRDNLLLHLLFKALFAVSRTRVEYLALLLGRRVPDDVDAWKNSTIDRLVAYVESPALAHEAVTALRRRLDDMVKRTGVTLSREDLATIDRFHRRFIEAGVALRFQSAGRPPQSHYPTYRELLLEVDSHGQHASYLASEDSFQYLKSLQARDLVIPVVGDLSGPTAVAAIGRFLERRGEPLTALYVSNVEFYLFRMASFPRFVNNLARIPRTDRAVIIRSIFNRYLAGVSRTNSASTSLLQPVKELVEGFAAGRFRRYEELFEQR